MTNVVGPGTGFLRKLPITPLISLAFLIMLLEVASRSYLKLRLDVPLLHPDQTFEAFYPELLPLMEKHEVERRDYFEVLLLGGSVLHPDWGDVEALLRDRLAGGSLGEVKIHNLAVPAHTSRDSALKYERLGDRRFDLIIFYHGINDSRANRAPPSVFDVEYNHISWYEVNNGLLRVPRVGLGLLYTVHLVRTDLSYRFYPEAYVPREQPSRRWREHAADLKTPSAFRRNLEAIAGRAASKKEPLLLVSFAHHIPPGYSLERFRRGELDYGRHRSPIEIWGSPSHVAAAIEAHNQILTDVVEQYEQVYLADPRDAIPHNRLHFDDVCHLTSSGSERFVDAVLDDILAIGVSRASRLPVTRNPMRSEREPRREESATANQARRVSSGGVVWPPPGIAASFGRSARPGSPMSLPNQM